MRFGCHLPMFGSVATRQSVLAFARAMEALDYDSLWVSDHVVLPHAVRSRYPYGESGRFPLPPDANFLEPLTTLTLVAGVTERIRLGTSVLVLPHRNPVLLAKMLATLDHLAEGRLIAGVGVGWMREEIELLGGPYDRRGAWSDEAIRVMRACWREGHVAHRGEFFAFDEVGVRPQPPRGDIPIWVGGESPAALRRVVALGDGWHSAYPSMPDLERGLDHLRAECRRQGRGRRFEDLAVSVRAGLSIRPTAVGDDRRPLRGSPDQCGGDPRRYRDLGVDTVLLEARSRALSDMIGIFETFAREIRPSV